jgi:hypothetical protein
MPDIRTKQDYEAYQKTVADTIKREKLTFISTGTNDGEHGDVDPWFSWRPCECCGCTLGGNREYMWAWSGETRVQFEICEDCVYYLEYGKLDDTTMLRIEVSQ